jgi:hypothetical protein
MNSDIKPQHRYIVYNPIEHGLRDPNYGQLIASGYNLKFSVFPNDSIRVSTPYGGSNIGPDSSHVDEDFSNMLKERGWTKRAIAKLEQTLINTSQWQNNLCKYIDEKTGNLRDEY